MSLLSWCQVLQQCLQQGSSDSKLPGCRGLPTGLHLLTVLLPAIFRVCNGSKMESTGADLRSICCSTVLPSALPPPAGLAQPVVLQRSPRSVSQLMHASDAACLCLQPQGTQQWTMLTTPRVFVLRGVRGQLPRGSRRPPSSPAPTLCRQGQNAAVLPSCAHRGCC